MIPLLRSELRKVTTTKVLFFLTLAVVLFTALNVLLLVYLTPSAEVENNDQLLLNPEYVTNILGAAGSSSIFVLILGIVAMTGEFRHMTITSTLLVTPRRSRVLIAKGIIFLAIGAVIGLIAFTTAITLTTLTLAGKPHSPIDSGIALQILGGVVLGFAIYAFVGVAVGALIRNQVAAVVGALIWVLIVEALLTVFVDWIGKWLPGGALDAVLQATNVSGRGGSEVLSVGAGAAVLIGYAVILGALASATTMRRDIT
jgi:ABC-2 type transport system permease protein